MTMATQTSLLLDALSLKNNSHRPPIWLMRQAGRYMPEYRKIRTNYSFLQMCRTPELVYEITNLPLKAFNLDAAILFSDILVILESFKKKFQFIENIGPVIEQPLSIPSDVENLQALPANKALYYVKQAIVELKKDLTVPLLGFCGAPFTIASYLIEGKSSRDLKKTKQWLFQDPKSFFLLLDKITDASIDYLNLQIEAGVDAIQIFDSWANCLAFPQFQQCTLKYLEKIMKGLSSTQVPLIFFCKGSSVFYKNLASLKPQALSIDWNENLANIRQNLGLTIALQGNLDPYVLYGSQSIIKTQVESILESMRGDKGFIFNLGHGILPDIPYQNVQFLVDTVKNFV
ncbi:Uroporphyrinogen decarboxylase [Candidatus Rubidus massiliensis]|nr:MAG: uroporphyrinogen decarboxylase [Chlamydia sp. 32-24]CDZ79679.1 Uroporphyrinogen decarboxylase [Candidatus Rubidus massiliensis]